jgi:KTSC domain
MRRRPVHSSAISSVGYDPESRTLEVEFSSGSVYDYFGVTSRLFESFLESASKGKFFAQRIRNRFPSERQEEA